MKKNKKIDVKKLSAQSATERISYLTKTSFAFLVLLLIGVILAIYYFFFGVTEVIQKGPVFLDRFGYLQEFIVSSAYAQSGTSSFDNEDTSILLKQIIIGGCFSFVSIFFAWCLFVITKSENEETVSFSLESIKTLTGFYIGALTGFLGA